MNEVKNISVRGARVHNPKNINVEIYLKNYGKDYQPRNFEVEKILA